MVQITYPTKPFSPARLVGEVFAASKIFMAVPPATSEDGKSLVLTMPRALTAAEKTTLDGVVAAHVDDAHCLPAVRAQRVAAADAKTAAIIARGFQFQGKTISLSTESQQNATVMLTAKDSLAYPITYSTKDNSSTVTLASAADVQAFFQAGFAVVSAARQAGALLKAQLAAAATLDQLNAIVDTRA